MSFAATDTDKSSHEDHIGAKGKCWWCPDHPDRPGYLQSLTWVVDWSGGNYMSHNRYYQSSIENKMSVWLYKLLFQALTLCTLLIEKNGVRIPVAEGRAYPTSEGDRIHNELVPVDCYRVCLELFFDECAEYNVLYPAKEDQPEVGRHWGAFLKWPKVLVLFPGQISYNSYTN
jgi:hypothetical protein